MSTAIKNYGAVHLVSSYLAYTEADGSHYTGNAGTAVSPTFAADLAALGIPAGATINSAILSWTDTSTPLHGYATRQLVSVSNVVDNWITSGDSVDLSAISTFFIRFKSDKTNTSYPPPPGDPGEVNSQTNTSVWDFIDVTLTVDYTPPYTKCTPPTSISLTPSSVGKSGVSSLAWSGAQNGTNNAINGYDIYSSSSPDSGFTLLKSVAASPTNISASAVNGGVIYYKIIAKGAAGASYYSDLSSAYAALTTTWSNASAPNSVTGPNNVVMGTPQTISWNGAAAGTNNPILGYELYYSGDNYASPIATTNAGTTSATVTSHALNGSAYIYKVKVIAQENSALSSASHTMTSVVGSITPPSSVAFDANDLAPNGQTVIRWSGQAGGINNAIVDYDIESSPDNATWSHVATTTNTAYSPVIASGSNNATIYYRVKVNGERIDAYSASIGLVTKVTKPGAPNSVSLNDDNLPVGFSAQKTLSWSGASAGINNAIYGYRVMVSVNGGALTQYGSDVVTGYNYGSMPVTSLGANGTQKFYVYTIGATSLTAEQLSVLSTANDTLTTTVTNPTAPTVSVPTNVAPGSAQNLSWSGAQNGTNNSITTYKIYEKVDAGSWVNVALDATSPYPITAHANNNGTKSYYIVADAPYGDSPASNTVVMKTYVTKPYAPSSVAVSLASNVAPDADVTLSWNDGADADYNNPVSGYRIMRSVDGGAYAQLGSDLPKTTKSATVKSKNGNGTHSYKIVSLGTNLGIHSDNSSAAAVVTTVISTPNPPSVVEVVNGGGVAPDSVRTLRWSGASAGAYNNPIKGYQVYRSTDGVNYSAFESVKLTANTYYEFLVDAPSEDGASYYYKVQTMGNTLNVNSAISSAAGVLTTEKLPSTATLNKASLTATGSEDITVTLIPQMPTYTHKVTWYINGSYTSGEITKSAGVVTDTYTVPQSWILATTKTTTSVTAKCKVETFDGTTSLGVNEYSFVVNVPSKSAFTLSGVPLIATGSASATAAITTKYSGYKHTVKWSVGAYETTHTIAEGTGSPAQAYAIPKAWCNASPNVDNFDITVLVTTFKVTSDGELSLGSNSMTFKANVPTDIVPTITSFTPTGINQNWSLFVRTKSSVKWTPVAAGAYSSTIVSYQITNPNLNSGVLAYSAGTYWTSGLLNFPGSQVFTLLVTDSRGRTATITGNITVTDYNTPSIASAAFVRSDSGGTINRVTGTYVKLTAAFSFSNIGSNAITSKAYYREVGTSTWLPSGGSAVSIGGTGGIRTGAVTYGSGAINIAKLYDVKVSLTDAYSTVEVASIISTVSRVFDLRENKAAFGGIATIDDALQVPAGWKICADGNKEVLHTGNWTTTINLSSLGAAAASHGSHVPTPQAANNAVFLRNDNSWQTITPSNIGAAAESHGTHVTYETEVPLVAGTASAGSDADVSRGDHVHPLQTTVSGSSGSCTGNAEMSTKLATPRALTIGSTAKNFDGSAAVSWSLAEIGAAAVSHGSHVPTPQAANNAVYLRNDNTWHTLAPSEIGAAGAVHTHDYLPLAGGTLTGKVTVPTATRTAGMYGLYDSYKIGHVWSMGVGYKILDDGTTFGNLYGMAYKHTNNTTGGTMAGGHQIVFCSAGTPGVAIGLAGGIWTGGTIAAGAFSGPLTGNVTGNCSGSSGSCTGNSATATKLATTRALTIGSTAKNFDGSAAVSWSLAEIGAAAASHGTHVTYETAVPLVAGAASAGDNAGVSRGDHIHPLQTTVSGSSGSCTGNAATATKLTTTRALTIGGTAKNFDGSAAVSWSLAEIGALALAGGTLTGALTSYMAAATTDYTTNRVRNIKAGTSLPATTTAENGSVFILYTA